MFLFCEFGVISEIVSHLQNIYFFLSQVIVSIYDLLISLLVVTMQDFN